MLYNEQLNTFLKVVEMGSFNKAAEQLYVSAPAVTKQINLLEGELKIKLFVRTHRGLKLTAAGKSLYQDAKHIIEYCEMSIDRAKRAMEKEQSVVRMGVSRLTPQPSERMWEEIRNLCPKLQFQMVPFMNNPENAREILKNLGQSIDVLYGIFDDTLLDYRQCSGTKLMEVPICCAVAVDHPLAKKKQLEITDLYGQNFLLMKRGWSYAVDQLRVDIWKEHPQINIVDFDSYDMRIFNQCENTGSVLMAINAWQKVHPMLKILPVNWEYTIPFGLLHASTPARAVREFIEAAKRVTSGTEHEWEDFQF